jgi:hypothetical protein
VAIHQCDCCVIELEPDNDRTFIAGAAAQASLNFGCIGLFKAFLFEEAFLDKETDEATDHGFGNDPHVLFIWVLRCVNRFNGIEQQLFPLVELSAVLPPKDANSIKFHNLLQAYHYDIRLNPLKFPLKYRL